MEYAFGTASESQYEDARRVWSAVYWRGEPCDLPEPAADEKWYVATLSGKTVWAAQVQGSSVLRGPSGSTLSCGKVAMVGTLGEARGLGVASRAMNDLNLAMRADGLAVAALYPYREAFYAKFGYARCGWRWQIKVPRDRMPSFRAELPVVELSPGDIARVDPCYKAMVGKFSGSFPRSLEDWTKRLGKKPEAIYAALGPEGVEGFFWARPTEFWGWMNVGEFGWSSERGYRSCLATMRGLMENQMGATWCEPPESPFLSYYCDQGVEATRNRGTMFRVLNVDAALASIVGDGSPYSLEVDDPLIPANQGSRLVTPGTPTVVQASDQAGLKIGVSDLSLVLMGAPSVSDLLSFGRIKPGQDAIDLAQHLMPSQVYCMDFF